MYYSSGRRKGLLIMVKNKNYKTEAIMVGGAIMVHFFISDDFLATYENKHASLTGHYGL